MSIQFGGLVSGLDTRKMITQLAQIERIPITRLQAKQRSIQSDISQLSRISSRMNDLATAAKALGTQDKFMQMKVTNAQESNVAVTAPGVTSEMRFRLQVTRLAVEAMPAGRTTSGGVAAENATFLNAADGADRSLTLTAGSETFNVNFNNTTTLAQLRDSINGIAGSPFQAEVVRTTGAGGADTYNLKLTTQAGVPTSAASWNLATGDTLAVNFDETPETYQPGAVGQTAEYFVNGVRYESSTNKVASNIAIPGVEMEFFDLTQGTAQIVVAPDRAEIMSKLEGLTAKYNTVVESIKSQSTETRGVSRRAVDELRKAVTDAISGLTGPFTSASQVGITFDKTGVMTLERDKFEAAFAQDRTAVADIFASANAVSQRIADSVSRYTGSNGVLKSQETSLQGRIRQYDTQIERRQRSVETYEKRLQRQFTAMESVMLDMQDAQSRFAAFLT